MNKKGFIIIWDWRFFLIVGIIIGLYFGYSFLSENGTIPDFFGKQLVNYQVNGTHTENLNYGTGQIKYITYSGLDNYFFGVDRSISYYEGEAPPSTKDFILKEIDDDLQYQALFPLVWEIRNKAKNPKDEANMAIRLVQNIPYDYQEASSVYFEGRYPYEVLYDNKGVCGEKSQLLAFLLKNLGYGVAIFDFPNQDHMAVGILCDNGNYGTNYCFIESTEPTQVGFIPATYVGGVSIRGATPIVIPISNGRKYGE